MRRVLVSVGSLLVLLSACGGGGGGEKPTEHPQGGGDVPDGGAGSEPKAAEDAGPSSTTTVLVGDGGQLQGTKLTSSETVTVNTGGTPGHGLDPNQHDPGRSRQDIMTIIKLHRAEARACYDAALKTHPGIEGNIYISWTLDPKGAVTATGTDASRSDIHDAGLVKCIGDVIKKIPWAPSPRGVETHEGYPFNFHPRGHH